MDLSHFKEQMETTILSLVEVTFSEAVLASLDTKENRSLLRVLVLHSVYGKGALNEQEIGIYSSFVTPWRSRGMFATALTMHEVTIKGVWSQHLKEADRMEVFTEWLMGRDLKQACINASEKRKAAYRKELIEHVEQIDDIFVLYECLLDVVGISISKKKKGSSC